MGGVSTCWIEEGVTMRDLGVLIVEVVNVSLMVVGVALTMTFLGEAAAGVMRVPVTAGAVVVSVLNCCGASCT